jgi:serum/glucocorticoid-regulated kinase 2
MEYINGGDFFKILLKTKGLPESVVAFIIVEVVLALEYLNN